MRLTSSTVSHCPGPAGCNGSGFRGVLSSCSTSRAATSSARTAARTPISPTSEEASSDEPTGAGTATVACSTAPRTPRSDPLSVAAICSASCRGLCVVPPIYPSNARDRQLPQNPHRDSHRRPSPERPYGTDRRPHPYVASHAEKGTPDLELVNPYGRDAPAASPVRQTVWGSTARLRSAYAAPAATGAPEATTQHFPQHLALSRRHALSSLARDRKAVSIHFAGDLGVAAEHH